MQPFRDIGPEVIRTSELAAARFRHPTYVPYDVAVGGVRHEGSGSAYRCL